MKVRKKVIPETQSQDQSRFPTKALSTGTYYEFLGLL